MCGFVGCLALSGTVAPVRDWVKVATRRLAHRGPDDEGRFTDTRIVLGFRRLAIIDPSFAGHQPMRSRDGRYVMVFNGEIYNYVELAEELTRLGARLRGHSDSEVLLEWYTRVGADVVHRLRGMYAFVIWDSQTQELFCARDPFGIKPFFYRQDDGCLRFSSEKKALLDPGERDEVDPDGLRQYLAFQYVPAPRTLSRKIRSLPPGHVLKAGPGRPVTISRMWRPQLQPAAQPRPDTPERILDVLRNSIDVHLRSDVPLGAFLSGGVDSAVICALAAERRPDLLTFTVGFERDGYSEIDQAEETAQAIGVKNVSHLITLDEFVTNLPRIVWHLDDPVADAAAVPLWFVAREARKHVTVVLSGEGSDELFGGYRVYHQPQVVRAGAALPGWARSSLKATAGLFREGVKGRGLLTRIAVPLERRYIGNAHVYDDEQIDQVVRGGGATPYEVTDPVYAQGRADGLDDVAMMQLVDINTWLAGDILVKADRMTMAHGLELRVPFLDVEVFGVAARLARREKINANTTKHALREAVSRLLPSSVTARPKLGFPVPIGQWLRGEMYGFAEQVVREAAIDAYIDRDVALGVLRRYRQGEERSWRRPWALVCFALWHQIYVEGVYDPVALGWEHPTHGDDAA